MLLIVQIPPEGNSSKPNAYVLSSATRSPAAPYACRYVPCAGPSLASQSPAIVEESDRTNQIRAFELKLSDKPLISQGMYMPPLTCRVSPVIHAAAGDARNATAWAMSSG